MNLKKLRRSIDKLDKDILRLLNERAGVTGRIGAIKNKKGLSIYSPNREKEVYQKLAEMNKGPLDGGSVKAIYREIMSSAISLEKGVKVAYLGPELTFTHLAAMEKFGSSVLYESCNNITDVFREVEKSRCDYGVVPIENSAEGAVNHTLDMFVHSDLKICAEAYLDISHNVLGHTRDLSKVKCVYSNPQVFGQCRVWLETHMPHVMLKETSSTAQAAMIVSKKRDSVCISSLLAKDRYGLKLIARSIEDVSHNVTRFLVIAKDISRPTGKDKTSVMISLRDKVGALHDILGPFKKNRINHPQ